MIQAVAEEQPAHQRAARSEQGTERFFGQLAKLIVADFSPA